MLVVDRTPTTFAPVYAQTHLLYYSSIHSDPHGIIAIGSFLPTAQHS